MKTATWSGTGWDLTISGIHITLDGHDGARTISRDQAGAMHVRRRWFRWELRDGNERLCRLRGISRPDATALARALRHLMLTPWISDAAAWRSSVNDLIHDALSRQRWIPTEAVDELDARRPDPALHDEIRAADCEESLDADELEAVRCLDMDVRTLVAEANERIVAAELRSRRRFFDTVEKSPLTDEQARAVVCFDNRVQVLAAAGSGKTSVMVARAAYAADREFVRADRILLLAFNRAAAKELEERIAARFEAAGIDASGVRASTFHSFGLDVIGRATGEKPRLASWLDEGNSVGMVMRIVDELRDSSPKFRYEWDLYRLLFAEAPTDLSTNEPDGYDRGSGQTGYRTFGGEIVRSHGERLIANFLYLNGVRFEYERQYEFNVADATHAQYRPDFYYPDVDIWHEHWALDRDGNPPPEFSGYLDGIAWKRGVHAKHGTALVESTWADVVFGDGLAKLQADLTTLGLVFDWNPDRPISGAWVKPMKHEDLARLVRTFMAHVKSNGCTKESLAERVAQDAHGLGGHRSRLFLSLYWPIHDEWNRRLDAERSVDFEDMLVQAAGHLEAGAVDTPHELVMVDEFQDASQARARLVRRLVRDPGRFLLAVGDDWQAINRFAGADVSVMTDFESWFGRGPQLALTTTFRCPQSVCDVASAFVTKNPRQFKKLMRSVHPDPGPPVVVVCSDSPGDAVRSVLERLARDLATGVVQPGNNGPVTVDVLGRYGFERDAVPRRSPPGIEARFRTVHGSKGLEADYIVIPGLTTGTYGFPSTIADDPVLDLAMPAPEGFAHAEERRLLYVALTRARRQVVLVTPQRRMSPFVVEMLENPHVTVEGREEPVEVCPGCGQGTIVERNGRNGRFLGCTTFPACRYTRNIRESEAPRCPRCARGSLVERNGRKGRFLGCTSYPGCKYTRNRA